MNYNNLSNFTRKNGRYQQNTLNQNYMNKRNGNGRNGNRRMIAPLKTRNDTRYQRYPRPQAMQYRAPKSVNFQKQENTGLPFALGAEGIYILYYSKYCSHCKEFLTQLRKKNNIFSKFTFFNVDNSKVRQTLPKIITVVPSILVPGYKRVLSGRQIFTWFDQFGKSTQSGSIQPQPFMSSEMGNSIGGDSYSYLGQGGDKPYDEKTDNMKHSFTFLKEGFQSIPTVQGDIDTSHRKMKTSRRQNKKVQPQVLNRPPLKQGGSLPPLPPISDSSCDNKDVNKALEDLKNRRQISIDTIG